MKSRVPTFIIGFCIPMAAILLCFPIYNRIEPFVFGLSFNYFWIFSWLFLTSFCLFIAYKLDPYNTPENDAAAKEILKKVKEENAAVMAQASKGGGK